MSTDTRGATDVDVVVVGAGMAGLYLLHRLPRPGDVGRRARSGR